MADTKRPTLRSAQYLWQRLNDDVFEFAADAHLPEIDRFKKIIEQQFVWTTNKTGAIGSASRIADTGDDDSWIDDESLAGAFLFRFEQVARFLGLQPRPEFYRVGVQIAILAARIAREATTTCLSEYEATVRRECVPPEAQRVLDRTLEDFWRVDPQVVADFIQQAESAAGGSVATLPPELYMLAISHAQMIGRHERDRLIQLRAMGREQAAVAAVDRLSVEDELE